MVKKMTLSIMTGIKFRVVVLFKKLLINFITKAFKLRSLNIMIIRRTTPLSLI
jgi:hypothetical protein